MLGCRKANREGSVPDAQTIKVLVLVKAAPVMTEDLDETMCVAGVHLDGDGREWARLHPVPFRDMADESKFVKYQVVTVRVIPHRTDRRPETWTPLHSTILPGETINPANRWAARRPFVDALGERTMCELVERNRAGSGPGVPSLAVVRPRHQGVAVVGGSGVVRKGHRRRPRRGRRTVRDRRRNGRQFRHPEVT